MTISEFTAALESFVDDHTVAGNSLAPNLAEFFLRHVGLPLDSSNIENVISWLIANGHAHSDRKTCWIAPTVAGGLAQHPLTGRPIP